MIRIWYIRSTNYYLNFRRFRLQSSIILIIDKELPLKIDDFLKKLLLNIPWAISLLMIWVIYNVSESYSSGKLLLYNKGHC